jgi:hypothetical protein
VSAQDGNRDRIENTFLLTLKMEPGLESRKDKKTDSAIEHAERIWFSPVKTFCNSDM